MGNTSWQHNKNHTPYFVLATSIRGNRFSYSLWERNFIRITATTFTMKHWYVAEKLQRSVVVFNVQLHSVYSSVRSDRVILPSNKIEHATLTIRFSLPVCAITKQFMDGFWPNFPGQDILFSQEVKFSDTRRPSHAVCRDQIWHGNGKERSLRSTRPQRKVAAEPQYWGYPYVCQRVWHIEIKFCMLTQKGGESFLWTHLSFQP